eukprot:sb/3478805/
MPEYGLQGFIALCYLYYMQYLGIVIMCPLALYHAYRSSVIGCQALYTAASRSLRPGAKRTVVQKFASVYSPSKAMQIAVSISQQSAIKLEAVTRLQQD